jgi:hypothetical protein
VLMAARLRDLRRDPTFRDLLTGWVIAIAAFVAGWLDALVLWIALGAGVLALLVPPLVSAPRSQRGRRVKLLILGFGTALLVSAMAASSPALGVLALGFFLATFVFGWEVGRSARRSTSDLAP